MSRTNYSFEKRQKELERKKERGKNATKGYSCILNLPLGRVAPFPASRVADSIFQSTIQIKPHTKVLSIARKTP